MQLQQETIQLCTPFMQDVLMVQTGRVFPTFQKEIYSLSLCVFWGGGGGLMVAVLGECVGVNSSSVLLVVVVWHLISPDSLVP